MSLPSFPRALDAREDQLQSLRAGLEMLAIMLVAGAIAGVVLTLNSKADSLSFAESGAIGMFGILAGFFFYCGRVQSLRTRRDLTKQQERLAAVVDGTGVGYWEAIVGKDAIFVSDRWSQMVGLERDPTVPMPVAEWR